LSPKDQEEPSCNQPHLFLSVTLCAHHQKMNKKEFFNNKNIVYWIKSIRSQALQLFMDINIERYY